MNEQKDIQNVGTEGHFSHNKKKTAIGTIVIEITPMHTWRPDILIEDATPYFRRFEKRKRK